MRRGRKGPERRSGAGRRRRSTRILITPEARVGAARASDLSFARSRDVDCDGPRRGPAVRRECLRRPVRTAARRCRQGRETQQTPYRKRHSGRRAGLVLAPSSPAQAVVGKDYCVKRRAHPSLTGTGSRLARAARPESPRRRPARKAKTSSEGDGRLHAGAFDTPGRSPPLQGTPDVSLRQGTARRCGKGAPPRPISPCI